jgi:hypothetical protein
MFYKVYMNQKPKKYKFFYTFCNFHARYKMTRNPRIYVTQIHFYTWLA